MHKISIAVMIAAALAVSSCGRKNSDKLTDAEVAAASGAATKTDQPDRRCASTHTGDAVKAQLFARAAKIRGGFADNYARIAGFALLELDGAAPVAEVAASEAIDCRAHAVLRLPPGLHASGGRTQLSGDIDYTVSPGGIVALGAAEAVTEPLATLSQSRVAVPVQPTAPTPVAEPPADPLAPRPEPPPLAASAARPSFDCTRARTASERAVCANTGLAALERAMTSRYIGAIATADPDAVRLLRQTRDPFLGYRERCGSDAGCIDRVYRGRIREIDDIVAGRWQGSRG